MTYRHSQASLKQRQKKEKNLGDWKFSEKKFRFAYKKIWKCKLFKAKKYIDICIENWFFQYYLEPFPQPQSNYLIFSTFQTHNLQKSSPKKLACLNLVLRLRRQEPTFIPLFWHCQERRGMKQNAAIFFFFWKKCCVSSGTLY